MSDPEDGGSALLRNTATYLLLHATWRYTPAEHDLKIQHCENPKSAMTDQ